MGYSYSGYGGGGDPTGGDSNSAPIGSAAYFENQLKTMADLAAQKKAAYQKVLAEQQDQQNADDRNWWASGAQGASIGTSIHPGWGTLIGGIIGSGLGQINAARSRHDKSGQSWFEAIGRTLLDAVPAQDTRQLNRTIGAAVPGAQAGGAAYQKYLANKKAADTNSTNNPLLGQMSTPMSSDMTQNINYGNTGYVYGRDPYGNFGYGG